MHKIGKQLRSVNVNNVVDKARVEAENAAKQAKEAAERAAEETKKAAEKAAAEAKQVAEKAAAEAQKATEENGIPPPAEMGLDHIPVVSQIKSVAQAVTGDTAGAKRTQEAFVQGAIDGSKQIIAKVGGTGGDISWKLTVQNPRWMAAFPEHYILEICLPGTHNSHAFRCEPSVVGSDFVLCQQEDFYSQLRAGIRFFDLRLDKADPSWFSHTVRTSRVSDFTEQVKRFLLENPSEVVLAEVKADFGSKGGNVSDPVECVTSSFGSIDAPCVTGVKSIEEARGALGLTIGELTENGKKGRLIVVNACLSNQSWAGTRADTPTGVVVKNAEWAKEGPDGGPEKFASAHIGRIAHAVYSLGESKSQVKDAALMTNKHFAREIAETALSKGLLASDCLSRLQAVILDYPKDQLLSRILEHNSTVAPTASGPTGYSPSAADGQPRPLSPLCAQLHRRGVLVRLIPRVWNAGVLDIPGRTVSAGQVLQVWSPDPNRFQHFRLIPVEGPQGDSLCKGFLEAAPGLVLEFKVGGGNPLSVAPRREGPPSPEQLWSFEMSKENWGFFHVVSCDRPLGIVRFALGLKKGEKAQAAPENPEGMLVAAEIWEQNATPPAAAYWGVSRW
uniref:Phosphatidylinositol-specific phospholipase C X domain-containing protein n=1 Tax=Chromera velia CCMP2878 TaxID=1169474 RepID=A0A0G4FVC8_9ALVE|eukprot:Cvel_18959.t1-p1 / transcript=Cvel_18959.t1 / gene=Cvel_18959 / organism=Chromera_velia_CCMP2878 / gene_product=hypothetical protein / transcript_product=hypothetical protein / location=Cvel_scaffold1602:35432-37279(+) / protein_length=616 / sequence_SO=supercontig / SO=protein_coding / is_pseudo=false